MPSPHVYKSPISEQNVDGQITARCWNSRYVGPRLTATRPILPRRRSLHRVGASRTMVGMLSVDRQRGTLLGLAVGDALGAAVEFEMPGSFPDMTGYRGGGPHGVITSLENP